MSGVGRLGKRVAVVLEGNLLIDDQHGCTGIGFPDRGHIQAKIFVLLFFAGFFLGVAVIFFFDKRLKIQHDIIGQIQDHQVPTRRQGQDQGEYQYVSQFIQAYKYRFLLQQKL